MTKNKHKVCLFKSCKFYSLFAHPDPMHVQCCTFASIFYGLSLDFSVGFLGCSAQKSEMKRAEFCFDVLLPEKTSFRNYFL